MKCIKRKLKELWVQHEEIFSEKKTLQVNLKGGKIAWRNRKKTTIRRPIQDDVNVKMQANCIDCKWFAPKQRISVDATTIQLHIHHNKYTNFHYDQAHFYCPAIWTLIPYAYCTFAAIAVRWCHFFPVDFFSHRMNSSDCWVHLHHKVVFIAIIRMDFKYT